MKTLTGMIVLVLFFPALVFAQGSDYSKGHGYVFFAPGFAAAKGETGMTMAHLGGGGEGFFIKNLGLGADVGYLAPFETFSDGIGTFSPNIVARFRAKSDVNRVEPFVTGGYTLFFREGTVNGINFGGGANWWFKDRVGLRFEVRDNMMMPSLDAKTHFVGFRIGLTFR